MNYYEILEIRNDASEETIKAAYKALAKKYHPDNYLDGGIMMKRINEAYVVLSDEKQRLEYDKSLLKQDDDKEEAGSDDTATTKEEVPLTLKNVLLGLIYLIFKGCFFVLEFMWGIVLILIIIGLFTGHTQALFANILNRIASFVNF